jgi:hypothetical protein
MQMSKIGALQRGISQRGPQAARFGIAASGAGIRRGIAVMGRGIGPYSRKVPQQAWTQANPGALCGTVTCADGLLWTGCRWMACKRSGVRIPIAPQVRDIIRKLGRRVQRQSTATVNARDAAPLFGSGTFLG